MPNNQNGIWPQRHQEAVFEGRERHRNQELQMRAEAERDLLREERRRALMRALEQQPAEHEAWQWGIQVAGDWGRFGINPAPRVRVEVNGENWVFPDDLETLAKVYKQIGEKLEQRMQNT